MSIPVLVRHDAGCKWSRAEDVVIDDDGHVVSAKIGPAHDDSAKRFSDAYNLHKACGARGWLAVSYRSGSVNSTVYDSRADAVSANWPWEDNFFYCSLQAPSMSVCEAASVLRWKRIMSDMERPDRDARAGGLEVIPFLTAEDRAEQVRAVQTGRGLLPMGIKKGR